MTPTRIPSTCPSSFGRRMTCAGNEALILIGSIYGWTTTRYRRGTRAPSGWPSDRSLCTLPAPTTSSSVLRRPGMWTPSPRHYATPRPICGAAGAGWSSGPFSQSTVPATCMCSSASSPPSPPAAVGWRNLSTCFKAISLVNQTSSTSSMSCSVCTASPSSPPLKQSTAALPPRSKHSLHRRRLSPPRACRPACPARHIYRSTTRRSASAAAAVAALIQTPASLIQAPASLIQAPVPLT
mmetsp:Transcript_2532/g.8495  ORF Transcript_2532/g.8495 Transcript_2532/m.8495 type:complete len:239 (+) Transcript_2532:1672-2388(+)